MKATVLIDNIAESPLKDEWGLCVFIEHKGKKILLDTGASALFKENAKKLGVDLSTVDFAVLSHAHYDHADGMKDFFDLRRLKADPLKVPVRNAPTDSLSLSDPAKK